MEPVQAAAAGLPQVRSEQPAGPQCMARLGAVRAAA
jgi:hypothetical protein